MSVPGGRSAKFELILTTRCQYRGVDLPADLGVDLENLNSSWPQDVSTGRDGNVSRSRGRSAKFELILTTRCQYHRGRSYSRSRGRSAKFELILTTRCQYWGVDLPADLGVDLPNLNSSWPQDVSTRGRSSSRSRGRSAKFELNLTVRCQYRGDRSASRVDLPNLNSSWPQDVSTGGDWSASRSRGRSAKFELILTTRWDVTTKGVDLPNLNSSWLWDFSTRG